MTIYYLLINICTYFSGQSNYLNNNTCYRLIIKIMKDEIRRIKYNIHQKGKRSILNKAKKYNYCLPSRALSFSGSIHHVSKNPSAYFGFIFGLENLFQYEIR